MRRGDIYLCAFGEPVGHVPGDIRPAVIISADETAEAGVPIVAPMTRTKRDYGTFVETQALGETSYVQADHIGVRSTDRLIHKVGKLDPLDMLQIETILRRLLKL